MLMISGEFDLSVGQNFAFVPIVWAILLVTQRHERVAGAGDRARPRCRCWRRATAASPRVFGIPSFITTLGMFFVLPGVEQPA